MDNTYFDLLLALAAIAVPLGLAGLLVELQARQKISACERTGAHRWC
jgi:hypothetical protein